MNEATGRRLIVVAAMLAAVALLALYLIRYRGALLILVETSVPAAACAVVVLACYAAGELALLVPAMPFHRALLIGFAVFGTVIGIVSWISAAPVRAITFAFAAVGLFLLWRRRSSIRFALLPLIVVPAVMIAFVEAITPVFTPDELVYKLAVPHQYLSYGRMLDLPLNSHSYFAMAFQLSDLAALALAGGIAAKLLHFCVYLAALYAAQSLAARFSPRAAPFVVAAFAYTPAIMTTAGWAFNEWAVLGLLLLSFDAYESGESTMAFAAAGSAAAGKYTALPWLVPFAAIVLWRHRAERRVIANAALLVIAFGAFFYIRNAVWTGSPFAPMFLPNAPAVSSYGAVGGWTELFTGGLVIDRNITDEALGILLPLAFAFGLVAFSSRDRTTRDLLFIGVVQMVILLTMGPTSRNLINGVAAVAIPGAVLIADAWLASAKPVKALAAIIAAIAIAIQSVTAIAAIEEFGPYLTGTETAEQFLGRTRAFTKPYQWIAANTPRDSRFLLVGETRGFYLPRQYVSGGNLDGPRISAFLGQFRNAGELADHLRAIGITHVLFHPAWYRVASPNAPPVSTIGRELLLEVPPATHAVFISFLRNDTVPRYQDREYIIAQLKR